MLYLLKLDLDYRGAVERTGDIVTACLTFYGGVDNVALGSYGLGLICGVEYEAVFVAVRVAGIGPKG